MRAFYDKYSNMADEKSQETKRDIEKCIWKTDEFGRSDQQHLKIDSKVAMDNDKSDFLNILNSGEVFDDQKSRYARNYRFFKNKIQEFVEEFAGYFLYFPRRILQNCIILPIEAESQDTALRIFSTLNDRGLPLSDSDIFKSQFYKYYSAQGRRDEFIDKWRELSSLCSSVFRPLSGNPVDEIFIRYMSYVRAAAGIKDTTKISVRKFYEQNNYALLKNDKTFNDLMILANFWKDVYSQNDKRFSEEALRKLFVLNYAPNNLWAHMLSVYFMANRKRENEGKGIFQSDEFVQFLEKITAFIFAYAIVRPGINALAVPVYSEMVKLARGEIVDFRDYKFDLEALENMFRSFHFNNLKPITKSILMWWAFQNKEQQLLPIDQKYEIEHMFARNKVDRLEDARNLELLGNKSIIEKHINIRASDYRFIDKKKYYLGRKKPGRLKEGTHIEELLEFAKTIGDFTERDIRERNEKIISGFLEYLKKEKLVEQ